MDGSRVHQHALATIRSPDLTPCDFFLWGYVKSKVYSSNCETIDDIKKRVKEVFTNNITADMLQKSMNDYQRRLHKCLGNGGGHVEE